MLGYYENVLKDLNKNDVGREFYKSFTVNSKKYEFISRSDMLYGDQFFIISSDSELYILPKLGELEKILTFKSPLLR